MERKIVNNALIKEGFKTVLAENGKAALDVVYEYKYKIDAIICDVEMPVMDGYTFTKTLKSDDKYKNILVIIHSSFSGVENSNKGMRAGADYYVVKFDPVEFIGTIKKFYNFSCNYYIKMIKMKG